MREDLMIAGRSYDIPARFCRPEGDGPFPTVILCHGTGSSKDEVGGLFRALAAALNQRGIASLRFDFAGCGESTVPPQEMTFYGEVEDTESVFSYVRQRPDVDSKRLGILGFSQGARVMAEFLGRHPEEITAAVSWSGECHNGAGVFEGWFHRYYEQAKEQGFATIPVEWRGDLILSRQWFDEIRDSNPMDQLQAYEGAMLAVSGTDDTMVPVLHAVEIAGACQTTGEVRLIPHANHTFNALEKDKTMADMVIKETVDWIEENI